MKYDPKCPISRSYLSGEILNRLVECGFREIDPGPKCMERVFERSRTEDGSIRVVVYTSIHRDKGVVRKRGADAIRVCLVRRSKLGQDRGLVRSKRVNRVGEISDIVDRMRDRMRECWAALKNVNLCPDCGAHKFITKKGKECCSELCFKDKPGFSTGKIEDKPRKRSRRGYGRRYQSSAAMQRYGGK